MAVSYTTLVALIDELGVTVETQGNAEGGGTLDTDTDYNNHGWPVVSNNDWASTAETSPSATLLQPPSLPSRTVKVDDGAGRALRTDQCH